jgi:multiple sugar transport system substrate-binding protein
MKEKEESKMRKQAHTLFLLLIVLSLLVAACGDGDAPEAITTSAPAEKLAETAAPTAEEQAETACGPVDLEYWHPYTGPDGPFMAEMVDAFNASHPDIQVTGTAQGEYYTQLGTAQAADILPDVAIIHAELVATQVFRNVLRPIDDLVDDIGVQGSDFPAAVWEEGMVAGHRYSIPLDIHPMTMFYNADLLKAAGFETAPSTAEEFAKIAGAAFTDGSKGYLITGGFPVQQIFQMLLHQFGGSEFSEDVTQATWNSEAGVKALQWMVDAQAQYSEPNLEVDAEVNAFKAGGVALIWNGIWQIANLTGDAVAFAGRATAVPQIGTQMAVWAGSSQLTLPAHKTIDPCKDKAAAVFIKYLLDNSVTWSKAGQIPASNAVRASAEFKAVEPQASIAPSVEYAFFIPPVPGIGDALGPLSEAVGAIMNGTETDIVKALDSSVERANQILAENRNTFGDAPKAP